MDLEIFNVNTFKLSALGDELSMVKLSKIHISGAPMCELQLHNLTRTYLL